MSFASKLRKYIEDSNIRDSSFAKIIGVSPVMVNKYIYRGSMPKYWTAVKIKEATDGVITLEDMGYVD